MWYEYAVKSLQHDQIYRRNDIIAALKNVHDGLSENSYRWAVGYLVDHGFLQHTGRDRYTLPQSNEKSDYCPNYSDTAHDIMKSVTEKYPMIEFTVFESVLLNEFLNHQIARNTIFLQVDRNVSGFVFDYVRKSISGSALYSPSVKEYSRYWHPECIIVLNQTSQAPLSNKLPHNITIEKMLVDIYCDKTIKQTYSIAEYENIVNTAYELYNVDTVRLLRYAGRRNKGSEIKQFIPEEQEV